MEVRDEGVTPSFPARATTTVSEHQHRRGSLLPQLRALWHGALVPSVEAVAAAVFGRGAPVPAC
jgi:hypothetical protein